MLGAKTPLVSGMIDSSEPQLVGTGTWSKRGGKDGTAGEKAKKYVSECSRRSSEVLAAVVRKGPEGCRAVQCDVVFAAIISKTQGNWEDVECWGCRCRGAERGVAGLRMDLARLW